MGHIANYVTITMAALQFGVLLGPVVKAVCAHWWNNAMQADNSYTTCRQVQFFV